MPELSPSVLDMRLHAVIDRLADIDTPMQTLTTVLLAALETIGAASGVIVRTSGHGVTVVTTQGEVPWMSSALATRLAPGWAGQAGDHEFGAVQEQGDVTAIPVVSARHVLGALLLKPGRSLTMGERRLLRSLAALCAATFRTEDAARLLEVQAQVRAADLEARNAALDAFVVYKEAIGTESDVVLLARQAVDVVRATLNDVSVGYYELEGGLWRARVWSEDIPPALVAQIRAGIPVDAPHFAAAAQSQEAVFVEGWMDADGLGGDVPFGTAAFIPLVIHGEARSIFSVGSRSVRLWSERERAIVRAVARGLRLTLERSEQQRQLEVERAALTAFARLTEMSAETTDVHALARQATEVLRSTLGDVSVAYFEPYADHWQAQMWSDDHTPEDVAALQAGIPMEAPEYAQAVRLGGAVFVSGGKATPDSVLYARTSGASALFPYVLAGTPHGLLTMGTQAATDWTERERQVFRAVAHSLGVALERVAILRAHAAQHAELAARTQALEAFAALTRGLSLRSDPDALVARAQEVVMSLLPPGYAVYYEPDGRTWRLRAQTGSLRNDDLQRLVNAGLPYDDVQNLVIPYTTGQPFYQEQYEKNIDNLASYVDHVGASATLPVLVDGHPRGVFAVVLFGAVRQWTAADKAVMETVVRSLGLAIEGAQGLLHLHRAMNELERSNRELEQFAYVASHDLQEPLRSVTSFVDLLLRRLPQEDERAATYARFVREGTLRMGQLIRDLLAFSRVAAPHQPPAPVDVQQVVTMVVQDLTDQIARSQATVTVGDLPGVMADPTQVRQVFQNLLGNALKFTVPGRAAIVRVWGIRDGAYVRFSVQDNGIGIDPAYHDKMFAIFQQLNPRDAYEGTGIGLAITRRIVERHGGTIKVASTLGEGATLTFTLPASSTSGSG
ncbi:ATP-binding protein [Deinococcus yunweiensis]|uniref:GAF domain-containing sensor histidine kinase n=1 Tax=Deinococcus yunweiensis TaxID=367282 RepID=UPI00398F4D55